MKEKLTIILVLLFTIVVLVIGWFWLQDIIVEYDLDTAPAEHSFEINEADAITSR